jgi:hypothetical protein
MIEYIPNDEAQPVADELIKNYHQHLTGLKIAYLFKVSARPKKKKRAVSGRAAQKKLTIAKAQKVTAKMASIAAEDYKFVIEFDWWIWQDLDDNQKLAVIDHELAHCGNDADGCYMKPHDLEEFRAVVERNGFYLDDVRLFAESLQSMHPIDTYVRHENREQGGVTVVNV